MEVGGRAKAAGVCFFLAFRLDTPLPVFTTHNNGKASNSCSQQGPNKALLSSYFQGAMAGYSKVSGHPRVAQLAASQSHLLAQVRGGERRIMWLVSV